MFLHKSKYIIKINIFYVHNNFSKKNNVSKFSENHKQPNNRNANYK